MFKPSFSVVTFVLIVFALLAFMHHWFVGLVPPVNSNALAVSHQKFLATAGHEAIAWHSLEKNTFKKARTSEKPILLVIGTSSSRLGQEFDSKAFDDVDTAQYVNLNFFCIRIDGYEHPEWLNAILPLSRLRMGLVAGYQAWTLDADGHVLSFIGRSYRNEQIDTYALYKNLVAARRQFDLLKVRPSEQSSSHDMQAADLRYVADHPATSWPSLQAYAETLGSRYDRRFGGFPDADFQRLFPNAWRFLAIYGNKKVLSDSLSPLLTSKLLDVQEGGFFRVGLTRNVSQIEFDKGTRQNAEMMLTLALQGQLESDPFYVELAKRTFDWLLVSASRNVVLAACQDDDSNPQGRSPRLSFPTWRMHEVFSSADRDWVSNHLGLVPMNNIQMVPYLKSRNDLLDDPETFNRIVGLMRAASTTQVAFNDAGYVDVNGHSVARMLEVARLWGDQGRMDSLKPLLTRLATFGDKNDLIHWAKDESSLLGYLGDYLALADTFLQQYLATGDVALIGEGLHYLNLARKFFQGSRPGILNLSRDADQMGGFQSLCVPELEDNLCESCTAQAIRLEMAYGRLTSDTDGGQDLLRSARQSTAIFADLALMGGPDTGGYFCAAAEVLDDRYAAVVGPNAPALADALVRKVPTRFVVPLAGPYRKDLQSRGPGIYIIGSDVQGPYTVEEAAEKLPATFESRDTP